MELYPYFMGPGNLPTMIRKVNGREGRKRRRSCKVRTVISHIEQERHFGLRPTCLSCQSKSGQFICSKSGQIYLLTTGLFCFLDSVKHSCLNEYMPNRSIIHIDMDAFFASVELKKRPELKDKPVIVGGDGDPAKRGVVSAASYEARKFGVKSGMPLRTAYKRCHQAVFLPVDFEAYENESEKFMAIIREYTLLMESFGIDEAFMDVTGCKKSVLDIAREVKKRIKDELGLTASV